MESLTLSTGAKMPQLGIGTWKANPLEVGHAVEYALTEAGYRHVDGAAVYGNEPELGEAYERIFKSGKVKREETFITSKLWNVAHKAENVRPACEKTLSDLKLDYLDLYLMHWGMATRDDHWGIDENGVLKLQPIPVRETWEAMQELVKAGLVKAIGVANFRVGQLIDLLSYAAIPPAVNQVELHPYLQQTRLVEFCQYHGIAVTAYSPLGAPGGAAEKHMPILLDDPAFARIAESYHRKTPAQVLLRWGMQRGTIVIPKSTHRERIKENSNLFDFELSDEDMEAITILDRNLRYVDPYRWGKVPYFD